MRSKAVLLGVWLLALAACSREQQDWRSAQSADTLESYARFLEKHPDSALASQARARVAQLGEERDWERASQADTADAYRHFLVQHPNGKWAEEARIRVENFVLAEAPPAPADTAGERPPARTAAAPRATPARAQREPSDGEGLDRAGFGIQLGAFSDERRAITEWARLAGKFAAQLNGLTPNVVPASTSAGKVFRLQAPVDDEASARSICAELSAQRQSCVVVLPRRADENG